MKNLKREQSNFVMPFRIASDNEYKNELIKKFEEFENILKDVEQSELVIEHVATVKCKILDCIEKYYSGLIIEAQTIICDLVDSMEEGMAISTIRDSISFGNTIPPTRDQKVDFFRARVNKKPLTFTREKMAAIPFESKQFADVARFSMIGQPCLYLGTTSYVCWLELNKPNIGEFNVSPIRLDSEQKILNLAVTIENVIKVGIEDEDKSVTLLTLFLLAMATSFVVEEENRKFKSEYVISQLIMLACKKRGVNGVAYYSKRFEYDYLAKFIGVNVAIFPEYDEATDNKIPKNIKAIDDAYDFSFFKLHELRLSQGVLRLHIENFGNSQLVSDRTKTIEYCRTDFFKFDKFLCTGLGAWNDEDEKNNT